MRLRNRSWPAVSQSWSRTCWYQPREETERHKETEGKKKRKCPLETRQCIRRNSIELHTNISSENAAWAIKNTKNVYITGYCSLLSNKSTPKTLHRDKWECQWYRLRLIRVMNYFIFGYYKTMGGIWEKLPSKSHYFLENLFHLGWKQHCRTACSIFHTATTRNLTDS